MKTITLLNEKGGVGKTTIAMTLACGLARDGFRVLLVDSDPQATATLGMGLAHEPGFYDLVQRKEAWGKLIRPIPPERIATEVAGSLYMLPGNRETRNLTVDKASLLLQRLQELQDQVDYVVIDTAPSASLLHILIYIATDYMIYPTQLEYFSLAGLKQSLDVLEEASLIRQSRKMPAIEVLGVIPTMTSMKTVEHRINMQSVATLGVSLFDPIPDSTVWASASATQHSIFAYDNSSKAAAHAQRFINQVYGQLGLVAV
jgi:chromosome partitioning protein